MASVWEISSMHIRHISVIHFTVLLFKGWCFFLQLQEDCLHFERFQPDQGTVPFILIEFTVITFAQHYVCQTVFEFLRNVKVQVQ